MGLEFLTRVRNTSIVTALVLSIVVTTYWGFVVGTAFVLGVAWSLVNLYFIGLLVRALTSRDDKRRLRLTLLFLIKVPVLYGLGFLLLASGRIPVTVLLAGFMWPLIVITLKVVGRMVLGLDNPKRLLTRTNPEGDSSEPSTAGNGISK